MAFPIIPVALGAGVVAAVVLLSKDSKPAPVIEPPKPEPTPKPTPRPLPPPLRGPKYRVDSAEPGFQSTNLYSSANENSDAIRALAKGTFVSIPNPNQRFPATPGAPEGWFIAEAPDGIQGFIKAEYLIGPVNVAGVDLISGMGNNTNYDTVGRGGGGGFHGGRGGGFKGGGFHRGGFRRGFGFSTLGAFWPGFGYGGFWPGYGYSYPYTWPGYTYPYAWPGYGYGWPGYGYGAQIR